MAKGAHRGHYALVPDEDERERCSCYCISEHTGADADAYVRDHLQEVRVDSQNWTIEYRCPLYGKRWLLDQPWGEMHGRGRAHRLRTFDEVRRDLRIALATVAALLPGDEEAARAVETLMQHTAGANRFRYP